MQDSTAFLDCVDIIQTFHAELSSYQEIPYEGIPAPRIFPQTKPQVDFRGSNVQALLRRGDKGAMPREEWIQETEHVYHKEMQYKSL